MRRALVLAVILAPRLASADGPENLGHAIGGLLALGELAIPDLRYEVVPATDDAGLVLAWPVALRTDPIDLGAYRLHLTHTLEYQLRLDRRDHRGLLVERAMLGKTSHGTWAPLLELGGVLGQDGSGGTVGVGVGRLVPMEDERAMSIGNLVLRVTRTRDETRLDLGLDLLQLPFDVL